ncbi:MAG: LysR family transcriptional regulator [Rhizobiaceae bacterium]|nr:LysR family transcriptional regulator [Rhizobiaceae bacterium]
MDKAFEWSHLQSFVAIAEHRSLSGAARALGGSQPTMGRHIAALEKSLNVLLFDRTADGLDLTPTGLDLLEHARQMADAAGRFSLVAEGRSQAVAGTIRITASEIVATYILPDILTRLHSQEPEIAIELVASDRAENLLQREADIAVRMYRPTQADVYTRKIGELKLGMNAAPSYLENHGPTKTQDDITGHDFIGYDRNDLIIQGFKAMGMEVDRDFFPFRSDNQVVCWRMAIAGFGIGFNQRCIGDYDARVRRVFAAIPLPSLPVWLTAHAELKTSRRVRLVFDFLAQEMSQIS